MAFSVSFYLLTIALDSFSRLANKSPSSSRRGGQVERRWSGKVKICFSELSCREAAVVSDGRLIRQCTLTAPLPVFCTSEDTRILRVDYCRVVEWSSATQQPAAFERQNCLLSTYWTFLSNEKFPVLSFRSSACIT